MRTFVAVVGITIGSAGVWAADPPPVLPPAPAEAPVQPAPPIALRYEDAMKVLHGAPATPPAPPPKPAGQSTPVPLDGGHPVNPTTRFVFRDATERTAPRVRTPAERRAAVEAVRRSLTRGGGGR